MHERVEGMRVGAILKAEKGPPSRVHLLGYGVYDGDVAGGPMGERKNPKITLDDGTVVWGCQCWWAPEEIMQERLKGYDEIVPAAMPTGA